MGFFFYYYFKRNVFLSAEWIPLSPQGRRRRMVSSQPTEWKRSLPSGSRFNALFNSRSRPRAFKGSELAGVRGAEHCRSPTAAATRTKKDGNTSSILLPPDLYRARFCHLLWSHSKSKGEQEFRHFLSVERRSKHLSHLDLKEVLGEILASVFLILVFTCPPIILFFLPEKRTSVHVLPPNISSIRWPLSLFSFGRPAAGRKTRWDVSQRLKPRCHGDNSGRDLCHPVFWLQWITVHSATSSWRRFVSIWAVSRWSVFHSDAKKKKKNPLQITPGTVAEMLSCPFIHRFTGFVCVSSLWDSSLAFISSQQPIIESHSLKRSKYILKKNSNHFLFSSRANFLVAGELLQTVFSPKWLGRHLRRMSLFICRLQNNERGNVAVWFEFNLILAVKTTLMNHLPMEISRLCVLK